MNRSGWSSPARIEDPITVPAGLRMSPHEHVRKSQRWVERRYTDLVRFTELPAGGHFTAWEQPDLFVQEVRETFRRMR